jgi:hypothetical protein
MKVKCNCHEGQAATYQDKQYGKDVRIANPTAKKDEYRCTVCNRIHQVGSGK